MKPKPKSMVQKKPAAAADLMDDDDQPLVSSEQAEQTDPTSHTALTVHVPPSLTAWLSGKCEWQNRHSQAIKDWSKAFQNKGHSAMAEQCEAAQKMNLQQKQDFVSRLAVVDSVEKLKPFEVTSLSVKEELKNE